MRSFATIRRYIMTTRIAISLAGMLLLGAVASLRAAEDVSPEPPANVTWTTERGAGTAAVESGPRGLTIRLTGTGLTGGGSLRFKDGMAATRFTIRMMNNKRPTQSITLSNGTLTLRGDITTGSGKVVSYFDRDGHSVGLARAAVTLTLEQTKDGHLDIHVRCARGVELGKEVRVSWSRNIRGKMMKE
jgi:hypothetical protein